MDHASGELSGRILVTGHDAMGKAVFTDDRIRQPMPLGEGGLRATFFWGRDDIASFPDDGAAPQITASQPPPGGCRLSMLTIPAGTNQAYYDFIVTTLGDLAEPGQPGFHTSPTLDLIVMTGGEATLELDDGAMRQLAAGDTAILNGVRHRWSNHGSVDATLIAFQVGANRC